VILEYAMTLLRFSVWKLLSCFLLCFCSNSIFAAVKDIDLGVLPNAQQVKIRVWYPEGQCARAEVNALNPEILCLSETAITNKVIVFSHGAMGSALEYSWVGEGLAAQGYIMVGINHFGESWVYGEETVNPRTTGFIWQRAQDISALLNHLGQDNLFQKSVDWHHVVLIGHSAGGQTAAMLAGARFELAAITRYCDSDQAKEDLSCQYAKQSAQAPAEFHKAFGSLQQDLRITGIVLLDPALGPTLLPESLKQVQIPALVVGSQHNDFIPWENHGARYAAALANSQVHLLTRQEGHFVFLSPCTHDAQVMGVALCQDRTGVDRVEVHAQLFRKIVSFIQEQDAIISAPKTKVFKEQRPEVNLKNFAQPSINLLDIIKHTPKWVFGLMVILIVFGVIQSRTRKVSAILAFSLPMFMLFLSFNGVVSNLGWKGAILGSWALGLLTATYVLLKLMNRNKVKWDIESGKYLLQGSWIPLVIFMGIFLTRYVLGVAIAMDADILHQPFIRSFASAVLGALSGFFVVRLIFYWQEKKENINRRAGQT
jgi:predicted dienelactone hydrolase